MTIITCKNCGAKNTKSMGSKAIGQVCKKCGERLDVYCVSCGRSTLEKKSRYSTDSINQFFTCNACQKVWCCECMSSLRGEARKATYLKGKKRKVTCPECNQILPVLALPQNVPFPQVSSLAPKRKMEEIPSQVASQVIVQETQIEGDFKQSGVLCLYCKTVTALGNKRCQNCKKKLKVFPETTVYYNGIREAVQCRKCGKFTDFMKMKCEHCNKKLKLF